MSPRELNRREMDCEVSEPLLEKVPRGFDLPWFGYILAKSRPGALLRLANELPTRIYQAIVFPWMGLGISPSLSRKSTIWLDGACRFPIPAEKI